VPGASVNTLSLLRSGRSAGASAAAVVAHNSAAPQHFGLLGGHFLAAAAAGAGLRRHSPRLRMGTNASIAMESQCHRTLTGNVLSDVDLPVRCEVGVTAASFRAW